MSKRFTDTEIWSERWFRKLSPELKCLWFFIKDRCDNSGVWNVDFELVKVYLGAELKEEEVLTAFMGKIQAIGNDKWWVRDFIKVQVGEGGLSDTAKPHIHIRSLLKSHGLLEIYLENIPYPKGMDTLQEKEKETDTEKDKDSGMGCGEGRQSGELSLNDPKREPELPPKPKDVKQAVLRSAAKEILDHLNAQAGARFEHVDSNRDLIVACLDSVSGDVEGVKTMVDRQVAKWQNTDMADNLRPSTLFRLSKFRDYYAQRNNPIHAHFSPVKPNARNDGLIQNPNSDDDYIAEYKLRTAPTNREEYLGGQVDGQVASG